MSTQGNFRNYSRNKWVPSMEMPLFPLRTVLFPGMMMPLHIFEDRYLEMINRCIEERLPFGVVLIREGNEVGDDAVPHTIGTAARITRAEPLDDGRMNVTIVGTRRFRIEELHRDRSYLTGSVTHYPVINGDTRLAMEQAQKVRPKIVRYIDLLTRATGVQLQMEQLPEDPTTLAFLAGIALQVPPQDKQRMLSLPGIPEMLEMENYFLGKELQLLQHMIDTHHIVQEMSSGPTGFIFPN